MLKTQNEILDEIIFEKDKRHAWVTFNDYNELIEYYRNTKDFIEECSEFNLEWQKVFEYFWNNIKIESSEKVEEAFVAWLRKRGFIISGGYAGGDETSYKMDGNLHESLEVFLFAVDEIPENFKIKGKKLNLNEGMKYGFFDSTYMYIFDAIEDDYAITYDESGGSLYCDSLGSLKNDPRYDENQLPLPGFDKPVPCSAYWDYNGGYWEGNCDNVVDKIQDLEDYEFVRIENRSEWEKGKLCILDGKALCPVCGNFISP